jgi:hypothetical protein
MSFYKNPRDNPAPPSEQGTPLPPSVLKVQQRRGNVNSSDKRQPLSPSAVQNSSSLAVSSSTDRESGLKRRGGPENPTERSARPHAPDIVGSVLLGVVEPPVQSAPSTSSPVLETMRSSESSSSKPFSSSRTRVH